MASVNKAILIGNLGKDPELRYSASGDAIANITIATTESWKDKNGEKQEKTEWHRISFFGKTAEVVGQYLKKGSQVFVEGRIQTRKWQDKEGNDRYTTEIVADRMQMLGSPRNDDKPQHGPYDDQRAPAARKAAGGMGGGNRASFDDMDDDIPF